MSKKHLKRLNTPNTWNIRKKDNKYIKRPYPGAHSFDQGMALSIFMKDLLSYAETNKEVKNILNNKELLIDGVRRKEPKFIVGLMDIISIPYLKDNFRVILNKKGKLDVIKIDEKEAKTKICKIVGKKMHKNKIQINLFDGRNMISENKNCNVGDSVVIDLQTKKISNILKLERGSSALMINGKNAGKIAIIDDIKEDIIKCRGEDGVFETLKSYAFVVGVDKPLIKIA
jgi:small subunit ribosomal protein S4e